MVSFVCHNCCFKFRPKNVMRKEPPLRCPNCGQKGTMNPSQTAEDLLQSL